MVNVESRQIALPAAIVFLSIFFLGLYDLDIEYSVSVFRSPPH